MKLLRLVIFVAGGLISGLMPAAALAHSVATPNFVKINGQFVKTVRFPIGSTLDMPQSLATGEQLVGQQNTFEVDTQLLGLWQHLTGSEVYDWQFGDGATAEGLTAQHTYGKPGTVIVKLYMRQSDYVTMNGAILLEAAQLNILPTLGYRSPAATYQINGHGVSALGQNVPAGRLQTISATGPANMTYEWDFGDGTTATGARVSHRFNKSVQTYTVVARARDRFGLWSDTIIAVNQSRWLALPGVAWFIPVYQSIFDNLTQNAAHGGSLGVAVILAMLGLAAALGAFHALTPGHGKTIMGAFLLSSRKASMGDVLAVGATVSISHTAIVLLLGALVIATQHSSIAPMITPLLELGSLIILGGLGLSLIFRGLRAFGSLGAHHSHGHDHHHEASTAGIRRRDLVVLGLSGGLVPSVEALSLLLLAIAAGRAWYGFVLVLAFSTGLAITLVFVGALLLAGRRTVLKKLSVSGRVAGIATSMLGLVLVLIAGIGLLAVR